MARIDLIVKGPTYFSLGDEKAFFDWLQAIPCVEAVGGEVRMVRITLKRQPSDSDLRELIALFYRFRMDMKCLAALKTARNAKWYANPDKFWYARVFKGR